MMRLKTKLIRLMSLEQKRLLIKTYQIKSPYVEEIVLKSSNKIWKIHGENIIWFADLISKACSRHCHLYQPCLVEIISKEDWDSLIWLSERKEASKVQSYDHIKSQDLFFKWITWPMTNLYPGRMTWFSKMAETNGMDQTKDLILVEVFSQDFKKPMISANFCRHRRREQRRSPDF